MGNRITKQKERDARKKKQKQTVRNNRTTRFSTATASRSVLASAPPPPRHTPFVCMGMPTIFFHYVSSRTAVTTLSLFLYSLHLCSCLSLTHAPSLSLFFCPSLSVVKSFYCHFKNSKFNKVKTVCQLPHRIPQLPPSYLLSFNLFLPLSLLFSYSSFSLTLPSFIPSLLNHSHTWLHSPPQLITE